MKDDLRVHVYVDVTPHQGSRHCIALPELERPAGDQYHPRNDCISAKHRRDRRLRQPATGAVLPGNLDAQIARGQGHSCGSPDPHAGKRAQPPGHAPGHANLHRRECLDARIIVELQRGPVIHASLQTQDALTADGDSTVGTGRDRSSGGYVHRQCHSSRKHLRERRQGRHGGGECIFLGVGPTILDRERVGLNVPHLRTLQQKPVRDRVVGRVDLNAGCQGKLVARDKERTCARHMHANVPARERGPVSQGGAVLSVHREIGDLRARVQRRSRNVHT